MRRNCWLSSILLCASLTACGMVQEFPAEELVPITEPATEQTETAAASAAVTETGTEPQPVTVPETEPESEPETKPGTTGEETPEDDAPYLLQKGNCVQVITGEPLDLNARLSFGDDHDPHPTVTYEGEVDTQTPGRYPITAVLSDSEGHTRPYEFNVDVEDAPFWETIRAVITFERFLSQNEGKSCGIDISKWQGDVDFDKVKAAGAEFVLMRIGYGAAGGEMDEYFQQNLQNAKAAGLNVGVYFYSTADSPDAAAGQADWVADALDGETLDFPVAFDWENFEHFQDWNMSFDDLNALYDAFEERMNERGYDAMLYAEPETLGTAWRTDGRTIWLADRGVVSDYTGDYLLRQAWNTGRIDGIEGDVDLNVMNTNQ